MKKGLVIHARPDFSQDKSDYLDEKYFRLLARRFRDINSDCDITVEAFDEDDSTEFFADLDKPAYQGIDVFAYIGHGGRHALYSADISGAADGTRLANKLNAICNTDASILLYACNSGRLGDSLLKDIHETCAGKRIKCYGHATLGRAGNNPNKTVFPPAQGAMLIDTCLGELAGAPKWKQAWHDAFYNESNPLWAKFWRMSEREIFHTACESQLKKARKANLTYLERLTWKPRLLEVMTLIQPKDPLERVLWNGLFMTGIYTFRPSSDLLAGLLQLTDLRQNLFAINVARWQNANLSSKRDVDGILGRNSWAAMEAQIGTRTPVPQ